MKNINIVYSIQQCFSGRTEYSIRICREADRQRRGGAGHQGLRFLILYPSTTSMFWKLRWWQSTRVIRISQRGPLAFWAGLFFPVQTAYPCVTHGKVDILVIILVQLCNLLKGKCLSRTYYLVSFHFVTKLIPCTTCEWFGLFHCFS